MAAVTIRSDPGPEKTKSVTISTASPSTCHEATGPDAMIPALRMLGPRPTPSPSAPTPIERLPSSPSPPVTRAVPSAYPRPLTLLAILIPACASSSPEDYWYQVRLCRVKTRHKNLKFCSSKETLVLTVWAAMWVSHHIEFQGSRWILV